MPDAVLLPIAGRFAPLLLALAWNAGPSRLLLLGGAVLPVGALLEALPPAEDREVMRDEARLLALRLLLGALLRGLSACAACVSLEAPEGCSLPALLVVCRVLLLAAAGGCCVPPFLLLPLLLRNGLGCWAEAASRLPSAGLMLPQRC